MLGPVLAPPQPLRLEDLGEPVFSCYEMKLIALVVQLLMWL